MKIVQTLPIAEQLIENGVALTTQLHALLTEEALLLKQGGNMDVLDQLQEKKQPLIQQINQFCRQIAQVLNTESLPNDKNGMLQYLEKAKACGLSSDPMRALWLEMLKVSEACQLLNEQNGASIDMLRRHTHRALQILKGNTQTSNTYGKDGSTSSGTQTRQIISV